MHKKTFRDKISKLLDLADIKIQGNRPWDLQIHNEELFSRVFAGGSLALGEAYMDGWWDCASLDEFFSKILQAGLDRHISSWKEFFAVLHAKLLNLQKPSRAYQIGRHHYDIGNDLYRCMLDRRMIYSCAYWKNAATLDDAQEAKLDLICRKLGLEAGMRVLDIGCGWGGAAKFAAERYNVNVVGVTVSEEQARFARELCTGLPVEIRLQDYRDITERFDRIFSMGMFEHVGYKNYRAFMRVVRNCLNVDGLFLLHTIGGLRSLVKTDPWFRRYIFPNSMIPSAQQICASIEELFVLEDWESFGAYYDTTLMHWFHNFHSHWETLHKQYDKRFYRMWKYYLLSSAGSFRARDNQLWQLVLSPQGLPGGYQRVTLSDPSGDRKSAHLE
ncbi:cyclopropane-fatty-acyl-phospholipid synthase [candidate division KSB3 bacterium]|uniref:Cyclopropane-fatty-acyl-phospholipid synthase n=1 Tax=candidate division KSB3 bacterium TaxID=2044937 RepID=A0A2G6E848_9BACT|nr:MAG: cyclopropane-fatty-acyl-phospholipid synthase [candidate division KSB3 bacterium]PIE30457.1 MAG: cyclopropane-fatty-acyl-phospholipid synthase [candidate division KSB3 bacterium]